MSQKWITECVEKTGLCRDETIEACDLAPSSEDESEAWSTEEYDSDCEVETNANTVKVRNEMSQSVENLGSPFLPTRLLDLSPVPAHTPGGISLVESVRLEKGTRYAALSYCWGNVKPTVLTTRANLESHQQNIKLSALPQCLRDAVTVARALEIRYLWIDALCIIQGDSDDWARESATMCQLFQNAYITIAAATSESFDQGFLSRRPFEAFDIDFSSTLHPQAAGKITLSTIPAPDEDQKLYYNLDFYMGGSKWNTRGWVWQEQKLSKRLLVFGKRMIHFKCEHQVRSENGDNVPSDPPGQSHRGTWTRWLQDYTPKHFTFLQDKLPAISGLAKQVDQNSIMRGEGPAQYLAGIWYCSERRKPQKGPSWQHQLVWSLNAPGQSFQEMLEQFKRTDLRTYTAPSWSWASRQEGVCWYSFYFPCGYTNDEAKIEDHQMNLIGPDPTGRVGPGSYLKLSGLLYRDPLNLSELDGQDGSDGYMRWHISRRYDLKLEFILDWNHSPTHQEDFLFECDIRLFCLWRQREFDTESYLDHFIGLLLLRDSMSGLYFRVGTFKFDASTCWSGSKDGNRFYWTTPERWKRQCVYIL